MFKFNIDKNNLLKKERNISFEEIIKAISDKKGWRIYPHPNEKYKHQILYDIILNNYIYTVVIFKEKNTWHLITAFPNRKAKKEYELWI